jgi:drug/metabolite transporter (DMT)-like permease
MALAWLTPALWAVNFVVARTAPGVIDPYTLALGRWGLAGVVLVALTHQELWQHRRHFRAVWYQYIVLGFLGMLVCGAWV